MARNNHRRVVILLRELNDEYSENLEVILMTAFTHVLYNLLRNSCEEFYRACRLNFIYFYL